MDVDSKYTLSDDQVASFRARGFVTLENVLTEETVTHFGAEIAS